VPRERGACELSLRSREDVHEMLRPLHCKHQKRTAAAIVKCILLSFVVAAVAASALDAAYG